MWSLEILKRSLAGSETRATASTSLNQTLGYYHHFQTLGRNTPTHERTASQIRLDYSLPAIRDELHTIPSVASPHLEQLKAYTTTRLSNYVTFDHYRDLEETRELVRLTIANSYASANSTHPLGRNPHLLFNHVEPAGHGVVPFPRLTAKLEADHPDLDAAMFEAHADLLMTGLLGTGAAAGYARDHYGTQRLHQIMGYRISDKPNGPQKTFANLAFFYQRLYELDGKLIDGQFVPSPEIHATR